MLGALSVHLTVTRSVQNGIKINQDIQQVTYVACYGICQEIISLEIETE